MESELCATRRTQPMLTVSMSRSIAIKKCQDDQEFDVTQDEIVGNLFTSTATIRVIQASRTVSVRDSVPPNSALRYDPALSSSYKKRSHGGSSVRADGGLSPAFSSNKRQKLSNTDPDNPIPSCERDLEDFPGERDVTTIPDSQQSTGRAGYMREIPATVSPPPHPALLHPMNNEKRPTDPFRYKSATASRTSAPSGMAQENHSHPAAAVFAPTKLKSASYHIERATERGSSVSTAATSPLSADQQLPPHNRSTLTHKSRLPAPASTLRANGKPSSSPMNGHTIYDIDEIESDSVGSSAILGKTKASLKVRKSPMNGLSPQEGPNNFKTPPNENRRNSRGGDEVYAPELPLTPSSKQREERQQLLDKSEKSRSAAAEAAERRVREASEEKRREAEEARKAERAKSAELARLEKEEQERTAAARLAAVNATAARLEKERIEKIERQRKDEEQRLVDKKRLEEATRKRETELAEKRERERNAKFAKQKREEEKIRREKAKADAEAEAERLRKEDMDWKRLKEAAAAEQLRRSIEQARAETGSPKRKLSSVSVESSRSGSHTGPNPAPRPQSSTPFIPTGRKSALKSSQAKTASSPLPRDSPSNASLSSSQAAPTQEVQRRVSFNLNVTPMRLPKTEQRPSKLPREVPPEKQSHTPIPPPPSKFVKDQTTTPILPPKKSSSITPPTSTTPKVTVKSASPASSPLLKNREAPRSSAVKGTCGLFLFTIFVFCSMLHLYSWTYH